MINLQSTNRSPRQSEVVLSCLVMAGKWYLSCFQTLCVLVCSICSAVPQWSNLPPNPQALLFPQTDQRFQQSVQQQTDQRFQKPVQQQTDQQFQSQFKSKLTSGFRSQFNSKLTSGFRSQFNSKLTSGFIS